MGIHAFAPWACRKKLVDGRYNLASQFDDFIFEKKLLSLKFQQFELIKGGMNQFLGNHPVKRIVTTLEFSKMVLESHAILLQKPLRV